MPKATLTFDLPEEREEFQMANQAGALVSAMDDVRNEIFRPARKHGYSDPQISKLLTMLDDLVAKHAGDVEDWPKSEYESQMDATSLIGLLEEAYYNILRSNDVTVV